MNFKAFQELKFWFYNSRTFKVWTNPDKFAQLKQQQICGLGKVPVFFKIWTSFSTSTRSANYTDDFDNFSRLQDSVCRNMCFKARLSFWEKIPKTNTRVRFIIEETHIFHFSETICASTRADNSAMARLRRGGSVKKYINSSLSMSFKLSERRTWRRKSEPSKSAIERKNVTTLRVSIALKCKAKKAQLK